MEIQKLIDQLIEAKKDGATHIASNEFGVTEIHIVGSSNKPNIKKIILGEGLPDELMKWFLPKYYYVSLVDYEKEGCSDQTGYPAQLVKCKINRVWVEENPIAYESQYHTLCSLEPMDELPEWYTTHEDYYQLYQDDFERVALSEITDVEEILI